MSTPRARAPSVQPPSLRSAHRRWTEAKAVVNAALPAELPAPPLLLHRGEPGGWVARCFEAVHGRMPEWSRPADVDAVLALAAQVADVLAEPPLQLKLVTMAQDCASELQQWRDQAAGTTAPLDLSRWPSLTLDQLTELEKQALAASAGSAMLHFDLRPTTLSSTGMATRGCATETGPAAGRRGSISR